MWKWILLLALVCTGVMAPVGYAESELDISVEMPLEGLYKRFQWVRIQVELTNKGAGQAGQVKLIRMEREGENRELASTPVFLASNEVKQVVFDLPADTISNQRPLQVVVESNHRVIASQLYTPLVPRNERIVAVLDSQADAFHFLAGINTMQKSLALEPISVASLPTESWLWQSIDILAVGQLEKTPSAEQLAALKEWLYRGGIVIISGHVANEGFLDSLSDLLPVTRNEGPTWLSEQPIAAFADEWPEEPVQLYDHTQPFLVSKQVGAGQLIFANYDIHSEPLLSWKHYRQLWQRVISEIMKSNDEQRQMYELEMLANVSKLMPTVTPPSLKWVVVVWTLYILLVAPLLYLLLKRFDRREWAWFFIPMLAVSLSVGIFTIGRAQVTKQSSMHAVSHVRLHAEQVAEIQTAASFLQIPGGTYEVKVAKGFFAVPYQIPYLNRQSTDKTSTVIDDDHRVITFSKIPYLSQRQAIATGVRTDLGMFDPQLYVDNNVLVGEIVNNTPVDMEEVYIQIGYQKIPIGPLAAGEVKQIETAIEPYYLPVESDYTRPDKREEEIEFRRQSLIAMEEEKRLRIIGISRQPIQVFTPSPTDMEQHEWNVFSQSFSLGTTNGRVVYPHGTLPVYLVTERGETIPSDTIHLAEESMTFALAVKHLDFDTDYVEIPLDQSPYRPFVKEIYNASQKKWEPLAREQSVVLTDTLPQYVTPEGRILLRFSNPDERYLEMPQPIFYLEGKERKAGDSDGASREKIWQAASAPGSEPGD